MKSTGAGEGEVPGDGSTAGKGEVEGDGAGGGVDEIVAAREGAGSAVDEVEEAGDAAAEGEISARAGTARGNVADAKTSATRTAGTGEEKNRNGLPKKLARLSDHAERIRAVSK